MRAHRRNGTKIAIIGPGRMGARLGKIWSQAGHEVKQSIWIFHKGISSYSTRNSDIGRFRPLQKHYCYSLYKASYHVSLRETDKQGKDSIHVTGK